MQLLCQRDPRWASLKFPYPNITNTLGGYGCTLTCLSMLTGTTPDQWLKQDIFDPTGKLVSWPKLIGKFGIINAYRYYNYNNQIALDAIAKNGGVLICVDAKVIGGSGDHWVLFVGGGKVNDPWDGKVYPTSRYSLKGMAVIDLGKTKSLPGTVTGGGVTLQKIKDVDEKTGTYQII